MQNNKSNQTHAKARGRRRRIFTGGVAIIGSAALAAAVLLPSGTALAAYQISTPLPGAPGATATTANVAVNEAIALTGLSSSFTLPGVPGGTPSTGSTPVSYNVYTNNASGYSVSVLPAAAVLTGAAHGATIPISDISAEDATSDGGALAAVSGVTGGAYLPLSSTAQVVVHSQTGPSADTGNLLYTNFEFNTGIPNVVGDTYSTTINYVATEPPGPFI